MLIYSVLYPGHYEHFNLAVFSQCSDVIDYYQSVKAKLR